MGKIQLHTKEQAIILDELRGNTYLNSSFYFTGGTALSSYYLHHRYSDDLDFFSSKNIEQNVILALMKEWSVKHNFTFESRFVEVVYIFYLIFQNQKELKIDFSYYQCKKLEKDIEVDGIRIDSLIDIAVNKLFTISQRTEVKDFVDLYFLLPSFSLWDLLTGVKIKFNIDIEPFLLAADFLKVEDFDSLPKMIKPLSLPTLQSFFREKAKELGSKSVIE